MEQYDKVAEEVIVQKEVAQEDVESGEVIVVKSAGKCLSSEQKQEFLEFLHFAGKTFLIFGFIILVGWGINEAASK